MDEEKIIENNKENNPVSGLKNLRTYQGDIEEIMGKEQTSISTIAIAEQERKIRDKKEDSPEEKYLNSNFRNRFFVISSLVLVLLGISAISYVYYIKSNNEKIDVAQNSYILNYTEKESLDFNSINKDIFEEKIISFKKSFNKPINSVLYLEILNGKSKEDIKKILNIISPNISSAFLRSLDENYMFGIFSYDTNEPYIILTTKDYGASYAGMLKWEETIYNDLGKIFQNSKTSENINLFTFRDESIKNKDLRILSDENQKTVLVYGFIDKNTIVITKNELIFGTILNKIMTSKTIR